MHTLWVHDKGGIGIVFQYLRLLDNHQNVVYILLLFFEKHPLVLSCHFRHKYRSMENDEQNNQILGYSHFGK